MFDSIIDDVKREFSSGNMLTRIIIVNIAFFILINIIKLALFIGGGGSTPSLYHDIVHFFSISSGWKHDLTHPWTIVTHMFLHEGFWHLLWNMLFLYWFGRIVGDFLGDRRVLPLYLLGGFAGAFFYFLFAQLLPSGALGGQFALGASAAVMAIVVAAGAIAPDYSIRLLFIGEVRLKYVVLAIVFIDLIAIPNGSNTGGHFAHLGGAFLGWFFVSQLKSGTDITAPLGELLKRITDYFKESPKPKSRVKVAYKNPNKRKQKTKNTDQDTAKSHQEELDTILDKIKQTGYESLTSAEKEFLFKASKK